MAGSIREALELAVAKQSAEELTPAPIATPEPAPAPAPVVAKTAEPEPAAPVKSGEPPATEPTPTEPVAATTVEPLKAPQSWKPGVREAWAKIPPEAQAEISRREQEIQRGMSQAAVAKRAVEEFESVVNPYRQMFQASNVTPHQAIGNLLQTAAVLQGGSSHQKAAVVVDIIKSFGVDIKALDSLLSGEAPAPGGNSDIERLLNERLQPLNNLLSEVQTSRSQRQAATQAKVNEELAEFGKVEFFEDLRGDMADIMEIRGKRGQELTLKQAYDLALEMHPEIKTIVTGRRAATNGSAAVASAAERASSVGRTSPPNIGPAGATDTSTVRKALEAAMSRLAH